MILTSSSRLAHPMGPCSSADRMMWITPDRVFYAGLLGTPSEHVRGAIVVYVALESMIHVNVMGTDWRTTEVAVVQPYVPHQVACDARHILALYIEPETVDMARLPALFATANGAVDAHAFAAHVRGCHFRMVRKGRDFDLRPGDFDPMFFGRKLVPRTLDKRIAHVLDRIKQDPSAPASAEECASEVNLSFSRFLHLFKAEVGVPFRSFRTWRRARSLLHYVNQSRNLAQVALEIGYPDSTHFSHSIRQSYGLKPRDIFAGSRKLRLIGEPSPNVALT